jgi:hypothetical protein
LKKNKDKHQMADSAAVKDLDVDAIIDKLLEVKG